MVNLLFGAENTVTRISQTGENVRVFIELSVNVTYIDIDVRMSLCKSLDSYRSCNDAHELDVLAAVSLNGVDGINGRTACSEHRIDYYDQALVDRIRKLAIIIVRFMCLRISVKADVTDLSKRSESLDARSRQGCSSNNRSLQQLRRMACLSHCLPRVRILSRQEGV